MNDNVADLETVLDKLDPGPVVLHGNGSSAHTAVRYAAKHPERVLAMVLVHCSITSEAWPSALMDHLAKADWDEFLRTVTGVGRSLGAAKAAKELLRQMVNQEDFALKFRAYQASTIAEDLRHVRCPTLVLHLQGNERLSLTDCANLTALLPDGRLAEIPASPGPWYWGDFDGAIPAIEGFLSEVSARLPIASSPGPSGSGERLSGRELEVLRLLAAGQSNQQIANVLVISSNTVAKHVTSIFTKTGAANRVEATTYAHRHGLIGP
jgi:DNA-binding CsgD family transcriptional regulator